MQKTQILQDSFLSQVCRDKLQVTVFLMNGFQMHGVITGFDCPTVALESEADRSLSTSTRSPLSCRPRAS